MALGRARVEGVRVRTGREARRRGVPSLAAGWQGAGGVGINGVVGFSIRVGVVSVAAVVITAAAGGDVVLEVPVVV